jgi:mercuric ion transport protein
VVYFEEGKTNVKKMVEDVGKAGFRAIEKNKACEDLELKIGMDANKTLKAGMWGSIITAICCVTPILPFLLGIIGLTALTPYLDYVLFPLLGLFLILTFYAWKQKRSC